MVTLVNLVAQIHEFINLPGVGLFAVQQGVDLQKIKNAEFVNPIFKNLAHSLQMNLTFFLMDNNLILKKDNVARLELSGYKLEVRQDPAKATSYFLQVPTHNFLIQF